MLGDGRPALHDVAGAQVGDQRAQHAAIVEAAVLVEAAILDGDEGLQKFLREGFKGQDFAAFAGQLGQIHPVPCSHSGRFRGFQAVAVEVRQARQGAGEVGVKADAAQHA